MKESFYFNKPLLKKPYQLDVLPRDWSASDIEYVRQHYANEKTEVLAKKMRRSLSSIYQVARKLKLYKSEEFLLSDNSGRLNKKLATVGEKYRFKKGHIPANKGKKMPDEIKEKVAHTFFQKGHQPKNTKFDGAISIRKDKDTGRPYKYIRLSKGKWEMLQVHNWKKLHGPIPEGKILVAIDGDSLNCDPKNWMLIDKATNLDRNSGRSQLTDKYVITKLSPRNMELREIVAQSPELIELKRNELKLRRITNEHD